MRFARYHQTIQYLESLGNIRDQDDYLTDPRPRSSRGNRGQRPDIFIKRTRHFLDAIGRSDRGFKYVHITGTGGKGTTAAMVHAMLVASGKRAGLFTSPYCTTSIEKITVGHHYISPSELVAIVNQLKPFIDRAYAKGPFGGPSYFELFTAIALMYFKQRHCQWAVLEAGMGGRYDATNVIENPVVTAIANINLDHTHILGTTLRAIARDKAGIIKRGSQFFTTEQRPALQRFFQGVCKKEGARFHLVAGGDNPNTALASAIGLKLGLTQAAIQKGLASARLPCRFEIIQRRPRVILDGAHNPSKLAFLARQVKGLIYRQCHLVIALAANKDIKSSLAAVVPLADRVYLTRFEVVERNAAPPDRLLAATRSIKRTPVKVYTDPYDALAAALDRAGNNDVVLVAGSFFLTGELRKRWYSEEQVLSKRRSF